MLYVIAIVFVVLVAIFVIAHAVRIRDIEERRARAPRFFLLGGILLAFAIALTVMELAGV
ncbi:hypothetical protein [Pseudoblastomonas halimionae]|uniref:Uncharacterized protein n=1 Tax=Alteriqipengyuania halimionae TaxID=1926630 RepID=A0A6I4U5Y3_9SPHN|nr:hypothetical protein [Alteriqipengyuania halimionae]MXP11126.1 hypothetical protein [Alteriqipengyuania halimionae]